MSRLCCLFLPILQLVLSYSLSPQPDLCSQCPQHVPVFKLLAPSQLKQPDLYACAAESSTSAISLSRFGPGPRLTIRLTSSATLRHSVSLADACAAEIPATSTGTPAAGMVAGIPAARSAGTWRGVPPTRLWLPRETFSGGGDATRLSLYPLWGDVTVTSLCLSAALSCDLTGRCSAAPPFRWEESGGSYRAGARSSFRGDSQVTCPCSLRTAVIETVSSSGESWVFFRGV